MALNDFRAICLPYCLKKQKGGGYIVLNREYKPIGFNTRQNVSNEDYPIETAYAGISEKLAAKLWHNGSSETDEIFLYNDGSNPINNKKNMDVYMAKLALLAKLKVKAK